MTENEHQTQHGSAQPEPARVDEHAAPAPAGTARFSSEGALPRVESPAAHPATPPASASERAYDVGPHADADADTMFAYLSQRSGRDWAVRVAAHGPANERATLMRVLARFGTDLASHRAPLEGLLRRIFWAAPDTDLALLRAAMMARFGLRTLDDASLFEEVNMIQGDAFTSVDLRRMWRVLERLPARHVESSPSFRNLVGDNIEDNEGVGGHFIGSSLLRGNPAIREQLEQLPESDRAMAERVLARLEGTVAITMSVEEMRDFIRNWREQRGWLRLQGLTDEQLQFGFRELNGVRREGALPRFDHTLRHEVGHAVDEQLHGSSTYCRTRAGGSWRSFASDADVVQDLFAQTGLASAPPDVLAYIRGRIQTETSVELDDEVVDETHPAPAMTPQQQAAMRRVIDMLAWGADALAGQTPRMDVGGQVYAKQSGPGGWHCYAREARHRQVSNYQFAAPAEWFAEAYAAYYDPAGARGDRLAEAGDEATKQYFDRVVHPFVARHERTPDGGYVGHE